MQVTQGLLQQVLQDRARVRPRAHSEARVSFFAEGENTGCDHLVVVEPSIPLRRCSDSTAISVTKSPYDHCSRRNTL